MRDIQIRFARPEDCSELSRLRAALWPESCAEDHARDLGLILARRMADTFPLTVIAAVEPGGSTVGFLEVRLRSHADSCDESWPVGYVEGWFVEESFRKRGIGTALLRAAEDWARKQGCKEMASDTQPENEISQRAHEALGFQESGRAINYRKRI